MKVAQVAGEQVMPRLDTPTRIGLSGRRTREGIKHGVGRRKPPINSTNTSGQRLT
jgi:hypothetical protein